MELLDVFSLSGLVNGIIALALGFFVILHNRKERTNQLYFLIVVAITIWSFSYWKWLSSDTEVSALFWVRMLSIGSTFIPVFYFHWIVSLLDLRIKERKAVILVYFLSFLFLAFSFSDLFIKGVSQKLFFPFWPEPGILYHFYLIVIYIAIVIYAINLLIKNYKNSPQERKKQIGYVLAGSMVAFGGGITNFFLWYDIPIPPYGNFLVAIYPILFGYATIKYKLFNVRVIATEMFIIAIWIFLLVKALLSNTFRDLLIDVSILIAVFIVGILLIRSVLKEVRQREKVERMTEEIREAYEIEKKARQELQGLSEAKNQFIMATQHHLRTPLTSMMGYIDLMLTGTYGKMSLKMKEAVSKLQTSTKRLIRIVNEILDISQFQLGKQVVDVKPGVDMEAIIDEMIEELQFETKSKDIYLKLEKPKEKTPTIKADAEKIKVALFNLGDNAVKYTSKGGVTVKLETADNKLRIIIKDTGIGIEKEDLPELFGKLFERGKKAKKVFTTGKGIGLFISSRIIGAHNGKVWAESEGKNKGSTFIVELPIT